MSEKKGECPWSTYTGGTEMFFSNSSNCEILSLAGILILNPILCDKQSKDYSVDLGNF